MLISYEPVSDILTITVSAGVPVQAQMQGVAKVSFDAGGAVSSVEVPNASTILFENGGQVSIALPQTQKVVVTEVTQTTV